MTTAKEYIEVTIPLAGFDTDVLSGKVHMAGCLGILEVDDHNWTIYLPGEWQEAQIGTLLTDLRLLNADFDYEKVQVAREPFQDWNTEWRKHFEPFEVVPGLWIRPPWKAMALDEGGAEIVIEPQMAFGTGHHETTRLMMQGMHELDLHGKSLLDLGTGSGILAIYAQMLGAGKIVGVDHDPDAIDNAKHNLTLNDVTSIEYAIADVKGQSIERFDVVLANINLRVLLDLVTDFRKMLMPNGRLLISGILETDIPRIRAAFEAAGLQLERQDILGEWASMLWTLNGGNGQGETS